MRGSTGSVSNPVFIIGIPVMVIIADLVTRGVHNFWWHLAAMVVVALLLSWPLRLAMGAYDRRLERRMQAEATPRD